jgi:hypothetical protein
LTTGKASTGGARDHARRVVHWQLTMIMMIMMPAACAEDPAVTAGLGATLSGPCRGPRPNFERRLRVQVTGTGTRPLPPGGGPWRHRAGPGPGPGPPSGPVPRLRCSAKLAALLAQPSEGTWGRPVPRGDIHALAHPARRPFRPILVGSDSHHDLDKHMICVLICCRGGPGSGRCHRRGSASLTSLA